jgi:hypothetical protein
MARAVTACMVAALILLRRCSSELGAAWSCAQDTGGGSVAECKHEMTLVTCTWENDRCYRPTLCTHDPAQDFVSGVLHKEGSFGTIRDFEIVCASGLVTCVEGRTFVDCGAALGHLTVAAASFGMTGAGDVV